jgi:acetyl esterase/lipase
LAEALDAAELTAPVGFPNMQACMAAIGSGQVRRAELAPVIPQGIDLQENVVYGRNGNDRLRLDLYSPTDADEPRPALVLIHGGAWIGGSKTDYRCYGVAFAELGYVVASIDYRIAVLGGSAGGHLAMMIGYSSDVAELEGNGGHGGFPSEVSAVVTLYGPATFTLPTVLNNPQSCQLLEAFLGTTYDRNPELWESSSPIHHLDADDPPTLIMHGTIDDIVGIDQSDALAAQMDELGQSYLYDRLPGWPHAMDMTRDVNYRVVRLTDMFLDHVWSQQ